MRINNRIYTPMPIIDVNDSPLKDRIERQVKENYRNEVMMRRELVANREAGIAHLTNLQVAMQLFNPPLEIRALIIDTIQTESQIASIFRNPPPSSIDELNAERQYVEGLDVRSSANMDRFKEWMDRITKGLETAGPVSAAGPASAVAL